MKGFRKLLRWMLISLGIIAGLVIALQLWFFGHVLWWRTHDPESTAFMRARVAAAERDGKPLKFRHKWVPYEKISPHLKRALVTSEDDTFTEHAGFNWEAIQKALDKNEQRGKVVAGGSTITQQLAKNLFLSGERSVVRKGQEAVIAVMLEQSMDKKRIFEIYLNVIEWGNGVFGAEAAARHYFGVSAAQLSAGQSAKLAAMVPRPRFYDRNREAPYLMKRTEIIQSRMHMAVVP
ncbi:MAG: monofunctional biosynthetic peptidoglycan transglycosylase [Betaproteobacteria bacterium]|nr:monofunctional biosynthetic peptidoglycan transglycosylase [Betaproteobacteria bacterium]